ncbi:hypothetical protein ACA910_010438 [Epithemia clementina (nom. ined.)]
MKVMMRKRTIYIYLLIAAMASSVYFQPHRYLLTSLQPFLAFSAEKQEHFMALQIASPFHDDNNSKTEQSLNDNESIRRNAVNEGGPLSWQRALDDSPSNPHSTATTTTTNPASYALWSSTQNDDIRSWGCALTQTPFIFVHIGKAGGGSIRRRIAAAAFNYSRRTKYWYDNSKDNSYYIIRQNNKNNNNNNRIGEFHSEPATNTTPTNKNNTMQFTELKAYFCNSGHLQFMPLKQHDSFEGTRVCTASTPIGQALACPEYYAFNANTKHCGGDKVNDRESANIVYTGHNGFGTELHWLPVPFLQDWWQTRWANTRRGTNSPKHTLPSNITSNNHNKKIRMIDHGRFIANQWQRLDGVHAFCGNRTLPRVMEPGRRRRNEKQKAQLEKCVQSEKIISKIDQAVRRVILDQPKHDPETTIQSNNSQKTAEAIRHGRAWSAVYASLPVLRVVMVREPFSWFASHYAWKDLRRKGVPCDNVAFATAGAGYFSFYKKLSRKNNTQRSENEVSFNRTTTKKNDNNGHENKTKIYFTGNKYNDDQYVEHQDEAPGWVVRLALDHIYQLCGSDCRVRHFQRQATLTELVAQAEANLRHAFCVVGILEHGQEVYFDMIARRVEYLQNISRPIEKDKESSPLLLLQQHQRQQHDQPFHLHSTVGHDERCKQKFRGDPKFQQALTDGSPEVAALIHLYEVAVQVNQFQQDELNQCRPPT